MTNNIPLDLLGRHISEIPEAYSTTEGQSLERDIYMLDVVNDFLGKPYQMIFIATDKNDLIINFTIYIDEIIDRPFYDSMVEEYGEPDSMYKKGEIISIGEPVKVDFFESSSTTYELQECTFDESPLTFIWQKEAYDIQVIIGDKNDTFQKSRIIFDKDLMSSLAN
ncbi:hypothetical protein [Aquimarina sp. 2201CG5-10]|uniref:hypothetical protein n=1 Tax=Aquimarina callyspongiae TaxID=3098150 RepID=UPI002AB5C73E|nr:hypothetical protein [Aquimarina sp. 2201CG5-10]MDY8137510.1 hypothetical protein [Aquimarina sp. 2201CG5-10]